MIFQSKTTRWALLVIAGLLLAASGLSYAPAAVGAAEPFKPTIDSQKAIRSLLYSLREDYLSGIIQNLATNNPQASQKALLEIQREMGPEVFAQMVDAWCDYEPFMKRFMNAAITTLNVNNFSVLVNELVKEPEAIRAVTVKSILQLQDEDLITVILSTVRHPQALKLFSMELDDVVLAEFSKKTFEDAEAFSLIVETLQKDSEHLQELAPGVDLYEISGKILQKLDKQYFKELLIPPNADQNLLIRGLSLMDGIIDLQDQEQIDIDGLTKQAMKMLDSPAFVFGFLWNIYFGDQSSQVALDFRKVIIQADVSDGVKDKKVSLRRLAKVDPEKFEELHQKWAALFEVSRFQDQMSDPHIILDPMLNFLKQHEANVVAETLAPIMIRSLEIRPEISKIVVGELPPEIIGALLQHVVEYMAKTPEGRVVLKRLNLTIWEGLSAEDLQRVTILLNQKDPAAIFDIVLPAIKALSPSAIVTVIRDFSEYRQIFFDFNQAAIRVMDPNGIRILAAALTEKPKDLYQVALHVTKKVPLSGQNALLTRISENPNLLVLLQTLSGSLDRDFLVQIATRMKSKPKHLQQMDRFFPDPVVSSIVEGYEGKVGAL